MMLFTDRSYRSFLFGFFLYFTLLLDLFRKIKKDMKRGAYRAVLFMLLKLQNLREVFYSDIENNNSNHELYFNDLFICLTIKLPCKVLIKVFCVTGLKIYINHLTYSFSFYEINVLLQNSNFWNTSIFQL